MGAFFLAVAASALRSRVALSINLTLGFMVNTSEGFSYFHATGGNPDANASYTTLAFVADRFVVVHSKDHPPPEHELTEYMKRGHIATVIDAPHNGGPPRSYFSPEIDQLRSTQRNVAIVPYYSLLPLLVITNPESQPVTVRLVDLSTEYGVNLQMASSFIALLPPLLVAVFMQRYMAIGVTGGAIKG